jgi:predicted O-linked N-acetylglucosamine transferase (SPINDLY family)
MNVDSMLAQAMQLYRQENFAEAKKLAGAILASSPKNVRALNLFGMCMHQSGQTADGIRSIEQAVNIDPAYAAGHNNLAALHKDAGQIALALQVMRRACELAPDSAEYLRNLGAMQLDAGEFSAARDSFTDALGLDPQARDAYAGRAKAQSRLGLFDHALNDYAQAAALDPHDANLHNDMGNALRAMERLDDALLHYERAIALLPDFPEALYNRGITLSMLGRTTEAMDSYFRAITIKPDYADAHINRGSLLKDDWRFDQALVCFEQAVQIAPDNALAHYNHGQLLADLGQQKAALAAFDRAIAADPDCALARWGLAMAQIPRIATDAEAVTNSRTAFAENLTALQTYCEPPGLHLQELVGSMSPFYLAYQEDDNRPLLEKYGKLCAALMARAYKPELRQRPENATRQKTIRVGIAGAHFYSHSVWHALTRTWLEHFDRKQFEIFLFHLDDRTDNETAWAREKADAYFGGRKSIAAWIDNISAQNLDVLLYPEIGIDSTTIKLASLRLAPVQMCAWGHPETSGLPTIDYYLSAQAFEPEEARGYYSEQLIALPGVGCCCAPFNDPAVMPDFAVLGIRRGMPLLICAGTPFKYAPKYDHIFVDIARALGKCQFVFFDFKIHELSDALKIRLEGVFARAGLRLADFAVFAPWQTPSQFRGLLETADVFLDTIGFSGFNTAQQALECGLPIVTREGRFMRGRLASGILRTIGMPDLIADSTSAYVDLAVRLGRDTPYRQSIRERMIAARSGLFFDATVVNALEHHLITVSGGETSRRAFRQ